MAPELLAQIPREERAQPVSATTSVREIALCSSSNQSFNNSFHINHWIWVLYLHLPWRVSLNSL